MIALIALPLSPFLELFERYVFGDWEFVKWLIVLVCVDTVLGFVKHWLSKDISSKAYGMIGRKLIIYSCVLVPVSYTHLRAHETVLVLSHVMGNFSIAGQVVDSFVWFRYFACTALMVREALSIIENVEEICPGFFPKAIINKLKGFDNVSGKKE